MALKGLVDLICLFIKFSLNSEKFAVFKYLDNQSVHLCIFFHVNCQNKIRIIHYQIIYCNVLNINF